MSSNSILDIIEAFEASNNNDDADDTDGADGADGADDADGSDDTDVENGKSGENNENLKSIVGNANPPQSIQGVAFRSGPLNQAVAEILDISYKRANELIEIGAVWTKLQTLSEDDLLELYQYKEDSASARALNADVGELYNKNDGDIDKYIEQMVQIRYRRVLSPTFVDADTDLRIYQNPRRFADACNEMEKGNLLLYEDTTFIVVGKPPILPTQPDTSNYNECCPRITNKYYGTFHNINGEKIIRPLLCHRVDLVVGGCVVMSKIAIHN